MVAAFDGGAITSDAGALLLGATDRAIGLMDRFAACFRDVRRPGLDRARGGDAGRPAGVRDRARLRGSQRPRRAAPRSADGGAGGQARGAARGLRAGGRQVDAEPAGAEPAGADALSQDQPQSGGDQGAVRSTCSWRRTSARPSRSSSISMRPTIRCTASRRGGSSTAITTATATCRSTCSAGAHLLAAKLRRAEHRRSGRRGGGGGAHRRADPRAAGRMCASCCAPTRGFAREELMAWCEANGVDFLFGLAKNERLVAEIEAELAAGRGAEPAYRQAGAALQGLQVEDARQLEPPAPGRRQGRVDTRRGQSALRRHLAARVPSARPAISTRRSTAPAATWRTGSRSASSISMPTAPRPPPCAPTSCACGSPRWPMCCSAPCAASACTTPPFANATCGTIRLKLLKIGALVRVSVRRIKFAMASACPAAACLGPRRHASRRCRQARAPRPPDTRRRNASIARHHPQAHGDPQKPNRTSAFGAMVHLGLRQATIIHHPTAQWCEKCGLEPERAGRRLGSTGRLLLAAVLPDRSGRRGHHAARVPARAPRREHGALVLG